MELSRMGVWCVDGERGAGRRIGRGEFRCVPYRCASVPLSSLAICPTGVLVPSASCRLTIRYSQCRRTRRTSGDFTAKTCSRADYHLIGIRLSTSSIHYRSQRPTAVREDTRVLQKRKNRSKFRLGCELRWAQGTMY